MEIVIGACELRKGTAFRFGNVCSGNGRFGKDEHNDVDLAFAVTALASEFLEFLTIHAVWARSELTQK